MKLPILATSVVTAILLASSSFALAGPDTGYGAYQSVSPTADDYKAKMPGEDTSKKAGASKDDKATVDTGKKAGTSTDHKAGMDKSGKPVKHYGSRRYFHHPYGFYAGRGYGYWRHGRFYHGRGRHY